MRSAGNWNNAANAGAFYRNWNNNRSNASNNNGFRAADYVSNPDILQWEDWRHRERAVPLFGEICKA
ncbi:hypothetical protein [Thauera aromatica]|uniref:hypothetical protein n=1 Tax=Thauera aromatica TaxID=59405 RepID=UPI001FFCC395|nr:hypothetical protein [Thauera aromatica]MCK2095651.1 hypothetical protein [Thauera aromatica]